MINRNEWSSEEDAKLLERITKFGPGKGARKAAVDLGRTEGACNQRYYGYLKNGNKRKISKLSPGIKHNHISITIVGKEVDIKADIIERTDNTIIARYKQEIMIIKY